MQRTGFDTHLVIRITAFILAWSTAIQAICDKSCLDCDGILGECFECKPPRFVPGEFKSVFRNGCYPCPTGCSSCVVEIKENRIDNSKCTDCQPYYGLTPNYTCDTASFFSGGRECLVQWCSQCSFFDSNLCWECLYGNLKPDGTCYGPGELPPLCSDLDENGFCSACFGYVKYNDKDRGVYLTPSTNTCSFCLENCFYCESGTACIYCAQGFQLIDNQCVKCSGNCYSCDQNTGVCELCETGFYMDDATKLCLPCSTGCAGCSGPAESDCNTCYLLEGYIGVYGQHCRKIADLCTELYSLPGHMDWNRYCLACVGGHYAVEYPGEYNFDCLPCPQECLNCESPTSCSRCKPGYYLSIGQCLPCAPGCIDCVSSNKCLLTSDGVVYKPPSKEKVKEIFFISYRLQAKIVWGIIFCEFIMIIYRSSLRLIECIAGKVYSRRVLFKLSLRTTMRSEYSTFSRKLTIGSPSNAKKLAQVSPIQGSPKKRHIKKSSFKRIQTK